MDSTNAVLRFFFTLIFCSTLMYHWRFAPRNHDSFFQRYFLGELTLRIRFLVFSAIILPTFASACAQQPSPKEPPAATQATSAFRPTIVFMTDFGVANDAVAICRAVIYGIAPDVRLTDITHQVTP